MKLYHVTSFESARLIMEAGFRDGRLAGIVGEETALVSLLDTPADENEGASSSEACIEVEVPEAVAAEHELVEELYPEERFDAPPGMNGVVMEWSIPAALLNTFPRRMVSDDERDEIPSRTAPLFRRVALFP